MLVISLQTAGGFLASGGSLRRNIFLKLLFGSMKHVEAFQRKGKMIIRSFLQQKRHKTTSKEQ